MKISTQFVMKLKMKNDIAIIGDTLHILDLILLEFYEYEEEII